LDLPPFDALPTNTEVEFVAYFHDSAGRLSVTPPVKFLIHPKPLQTLDFDTFADGREPLRGSVIGDQWSEVGLSISAVSASAAGPDVAILYDSAKPTGDDMELLTPGSGPMNTEAQRLILVVAENDIDADQDGVLDVPDSAELGGKLLFKFTREVYVYEISLIDIDPGQVTVLRGFSGDDLVHDFSIPDAGYNLGNNNLACMGFADIPISMLEVDLGGSGGVADLSFIPATAAVNFDRTMTGTSLELRAGTVMDQQFIADQGFLIRGETWRAGIPDAVVSFDTSRPTGGDDDLQTPGYHPTNRLPQEMALVLAQDVKDIDGDGLVDVPNASAYGGTITIDFEYDVVFESASVLDVDRREGSYLQLWAKESSGRCTVYRLMATVPFERLGDNSFQTLNLVYPGVGRIDFVLGGSTAVTGFSFRRDEGWSLR
jgi:hypothetical protein